MNADRIHAVPPIAAVRAAYAGLDTFNGFANAEKVAGIAILFTALCEELHLEPAQMIDASRRRMRDHQNIIHAREVDSLRAFIRGEVAR